MSEQISTILKRKLDDLDAYGAIDAEISRNVLKEELQFYVLNFIYHHAKYNSWIMYGGSALRIIHGLDRMSVDLDFEISHAITDKFLEELKKEIEDHFANAYGALADFLNLKITARGVLLKFHLGEELRFGHTSKQVHVKIDLNHFVAPKTVTERRPINRDQMSFVILTYNMSSLMASKIAAIFQRGSRGVGKVVYTEKGRDIYDLLWYMNKKAMPDFDYLNAKNVEEAKDVRTLFDKLTLKMSSVSDDNLKQDLTPLFVNRTYIENWLKNWRESYMRLLDNYKINNVAMLEEIIIQKDFRTSGYSFAHWYKTKNGGSISITYEISDYWVDFRDGDLLIKADEKLNDFIQFTDNIKPAYQDKLKQYATLFYEKTEKYFKKTKRVMLGDSISTKVIRMTADNLNQKDQIVLNKSALLSCELDDLLK